MAKDRLTQHIEDLKADIARLVESDSRVARFVGLQDSLTRAESVNQEILEAEERIPVMPEPKERKPRRKQTEGTEINGIRITGIPAADFDPTLEEGRE